MLNKKLIKRVRILISIVVTITVFVFGYFLGDGVRKGVINKEQSKVTQIETKTNIDEELKTKTKDFLIAYYTKKDLGENRDRYRPLMTEGMYNATVAEEEKAGTKAYQGYIVDWEFQEVDMYINADKNEVLVNVRYKNTTLAMKDDKSKQNVRSNKSSYKLTYVKVDKTLLVNKMEQMLIEPVVEGRS